MIRRNCEPGELVELARERERLIHAQALTAFAAEGYARLYEQDGRWSNSWASCSTRPSRGSTSMPDWLRWCSGWRRSTPRSRTWRTRLRQMGQHWEASPERLDEVERRLQQLRRLEAKYRKPIEELIAYRAGLDQQEAKLQQQEDDLSGLEAELSQAFAELRRTAAELSRQRKKAAGKLAALAQKRAGRPGHGRGPPGGGLAADPAGRRSAAAEVPAWGCDHLELTLAANPGEPARPLRKVASGGELSRTMLALKTVLAGHDRLHTLVFDEIDANVGGRLGDVLGQKLAALGRTHQVICVTHLPQVASYARHHWTIRKTRRGNRTVTRIAQLTETERLEELASMLRGEVRGETTRQEAAAMLEAARPSW